MGGGNLTHTHQMEQKIFLLGEAWGAEEEKRKTPFVGYAGQQLNSMLEEAEIRRRDCYVSNVFNLRPANNNVGEFCGPRDHGIPGYPQLLSGKWVRAEFASELNRLAREIEEVSPNIIVAFGNTASWALFGRTAITKYRGFVDQTSHTAIGYKGISTYHPQACNYVASWRPIAVIDLMKARRQSEFPEIRRPEREIWIEPEIEDCYEFDRRYLEPARTIGVDIETSGSRVTCIGFSTRSHGLVVPFDDTRKKNRSYWPTAIDERKAWKFVRGVLRRPTEKVFQNGLYDISFLWRAYGIRVKNPEHDTMLLHHALQPESLKALGFLGSVYTDEGPWKTMHEHRTTIKRDD